MHYFRTCTILTSLLAVVCAGCGDANVKLSIGELRERQRTRVAEEVQRDPEQFLRLLMPELATMKEYRVDFCRQERLGFIPRLQEQDCIDASYRREPLSIKFVWQGEESDYVEAVYVEGVNNNRVTLLPRRGFLGLPVEPVSFPPQAAVTFGRARNVMTDFGVHRLVERTLIRIDESRAIGPVSVKYIGLRDFEGRDAHQIEINYPKGDGFPNNKQDLYLRAQDGVPIGTLAWLPNGDLDAAYLYLNLVTATEPIPDDVFTVKPRAKAEAASQPASR